MKSFFYAREAINGKSAADVTTLQMRPYRVTRSASGSGSATTTEETDWGYVPHSYTHPYPPSTTTSTANFVRPNAVKSFVGSNSSKVRYAYDGYGNVTTVWEHGAADAADGNWLRQKSTEYYSYVNASAYIVSKPSRQTVQGIDGVTTGVTTVSDMRYVYDGAGRGLVTATRLILDGSRSVDVSYDYDAFGNQTSQTTYGDYGNPGGGIATADPRTTTVTYDTQYRLFPVTITGPSPDGSAAGFVETSGL